MLNNECVLYNRECIDCGECDICDLDKNKICDNCAKCIEIDCDVIKIEIEKIVDSDD